MIKFIYFYDLYVWECLDVVGKILFWLFVRDRGIFGYIIKYLFL